MTWNCGESRPPAFSSFFRWIDENSSDKSLIVVGLQEVEMGSTSVALAAAKETLASRAQEKGNANAQFWLSAILSALGSKSWYSVSLRQLSGMLILVFARKDLEPELGGVCTSSVACGILGVGGNKGAVGVQLTLFRHRFAFICSHFAAHQNSVDIRNANYHTIVRYLSFKQHPSIFDDASDTESVTDTTAEVENSENEASLLAAASNTIASAAGSLLSYRPLRDSSELGAIGDAPKAENEPMPKTNTALSDLENESLKSADTVFWLGDFNYRIDGNYDQVKELIVSGHYDPLLKCDQLGREHAQGRVFKGFREPKITFAPTYKFDKGISSAYAYDSSEKKRVPSWCDRIMYRGSTPFLSAQPSASEIEAMASPSQNKVDVIPQEYGTWMDVIESDHKPVYGSFNVSLTRVDAEKKREIVSDTLLRYQPHLASVPRAKVSPSNVRLHSFHLPEESVCLENRSSEKIFFTIIPDTVSRETATLIEVRPIQGIIAPGSQKAVYFRANSSSKSSMIDRNRVKSVKFEVIMESQLAPGSAMDQHSKRFELTAAIVSDTEF